VTAHSGRTGSMSGRCHSREAAQRASGLSPLPRYCCVALPKSPLIMIKAAPLRGAAARRQRRPLALGGPGRRAPGPTAQPPLINLAHRASSRCCTEPSSSGFIVQLVAIASRALPAVASHAIGSPTLDSLPTRRDLRLSRKTGAEQDQGGVPQRLDSSAGLAIASPAVYKASMTERAMQEATFLILTALADGSQHGYAIIAEVQEISGGRVRLRAGTLYTALDRLRADGLIEVDREEIVEGRLRRYYRLTPEGTGRLAAEAARLQANARAALTRLKPLGVVT
jgi:DNA-binding PadR family transcriptional regulator